MSLSVEEFYHDFRQEILAGSEVAQDFLEAEFALWLARELEESGVIGGYEPAHYKAPRGMRVDGYWFGDDEDVLDLFILDFANRETLESLTQTDVESTFKRVENFFVQCIEKKLYEQLEVTSQGYGLARDISDRRGTYSKVNLYLLSDRKLSERLQSIEEKTYKTWNISFQIWDISRFYRLYTAKGAKEEIVIDFTEKDRDGLQCLPAYLKTADYQSYLLVMPGEILAGIYGKYGARLLEHNVRCFLQARGNVNKGIRATILNDPEMFFAYNNGITATAREVICKQINGGTYVQKIRDLQIVNGGQTTASLFHTNRKDRASLEKIFLQVKLSVIEDERSEQVVPKISEYANTQNKVNAADFFSNHPFHIRLEEFSRRIYAPPKQGALRETKWFYERARGQYSDAEAKMTFAERKKHRAQYPKYQMFTKTDLAKYENVWDDKPTYVNLGAQKNFAKYAERIGQEWEKEADKFNEYYYKCSIAKAILFKRTESIVSSEAWYEGGYRANIVAYTLALISSYCKAYKKSINYINIWDKQEITAASIQAIQIASKLVFEDISQPMSGIANISEWCKKEACWNKISSRIMQLHDVLPQEFKKQLISRDNVKEDIKDAKNIQKIDNNIEMQMQVLKYTKDQWKHLLDESRKKSFLTPKEVGILEVATYRLPSEKQSIVLIEVLRKAELEGIVLK